MSIVKQLKRAKSISRTVNLLFELATNAPDKEYAEKVVHAGCIKVLQNMLTGDHNLVPGAVTCILQLGNTLPLEVFELIEGDLLVESVHQVHLMDNDPRDPVLQLFMVFAFKVIGFDSAVDRLDVYIPLVCRALELGLQVTKCLVFLMGVFDHHPSTILDNLSTKALVNYVMCDDIEIQCNTLIIIRLTSMACSPFCKDLFYEGLAEAIEYAQETEALIPFTNKLLAGLMFGSHRSHAAPLIKSAVTKPIDVETEKYLMCAVYYALRYDKTLIPSIVNKQLLSRFVSTPSVDTMRALDIVLSYADSTYEGTWNPYVVWLKEMKVVPILRDLKDIDPLVDRILTKWFT